MISTCKSILRSSLILCLLLSQQAWGHATVSPKQSTQDSYQRLSFGISHGCEGSPTLEVVVELPEAVMGAKPMPKPGWSVETEVRPLSVPYTLHGKEIKQDVRVVRWRGKLIDAHYDEFVIMSKLWNKTGPIFIPVAQVCEKGRMDWNQLPDGSGARLNFPAPVLEVMPGEHKH